MRQYIRSREGQQAFQRKPDRVEIGIKRYYNMALSMTRNGVVTLEQYEALAEFRGQIRQFLRFSENASRAVGLKPKQHQLLLALKGLREAQQPSISDLAAQLLIPHHTAVSLVEGLKNRGLVNRRRSNEDRRKAVVTITSSGEALLRQVSLRNLGKLRAMEPILRGLLNRLIGSSPALEEPAKPVISEGVPEVAPSQGDAAQPQRVADH